MFNISYLDVNGLQYSVTTYSICSIYMYFGDEFNISERWVGNVNSKKIRHLYISYIRMVSLSVPPFEINTNDNISVINEIFVVMLGNCHTTKLNP